MYSARTTVSSSRSAASGTGPSCSGSAQTSTSPSTPDSRRLTLSPLVTCSIRFVEQFDHVHYAPPRSVPRNTRTKLQQAPGFAVAMMSAPVPRARGISRSSIEDAISGCATL